MLNKVQKLSEPGIYLALGGGAARGLVHLGVLLALEEHQIPIAGICGTSMGSLIGANYALNPNAEQLCHDIRDYIQSNHYQRAKYAFMRAVRKNEKNGKTSFLKKVSQGFLVGRSITMGSVITFEEYRSEIYGLVPEKTFSNTKIPFYCMAVDLTNNQEVLFDRGLLRSAIMASCAIPAAFPPVKSGDILYVDGGWMNKVPVRPLATMGAKNILAVDVYHKEESEIKVNRGYTLMNLANNATEQRLLELQMEPASLIWRPVVTDLHWAEFTQVEKAIDIGYNYAVERIDGLKELLNREAPKESRMERFLRRVIKKPEPVSETCHFPFDVRGIWDVTSAE